MHFVWTVQAQKELTLLDRPLQKRIATKMRWFEGQSDPLSFAESIKGEHGIYRFRVGSYRVFLHENGTVLVILRIRKRSEAYR